MQYHLLLDHDASRVQSILLQHICMSPLETNVDFMNTLVQFGEHWISSNPINKHPNIHNLAAQYENYLIYTLDKSPSHFYSTNPCVKSFQFEYNRSGLTVKCIAYVNQLIYVPKDISGIIISSVCYVQFWCAWVSWLQTENVQQRYLTLQWRRNQARNKENIETPRLWPLWGEFTCERWIPLTKGTVTLKMPSFDDGI